jgi:inosine/xanthosine triphosphatase
VPLESARRRVAHLHTDMERIVVAVGSTRKPKLKAVTEALDAFASLLAPQTHLEVVGVEVESGVSHTPVSREELMRGARQRAGALLRLAYQKGHSWSYFIGLEGGLDVVPESAASAGMLGPPTPFEYRRRVFLESWAYVTDGTRGHFGRSGGVELPEALASEVLENGIELSVAIDRFAGAVGIRDRQGAWGVLSSNLITRQEAFRVAVVAAFAPFYNAKMYSTAAAVGGVP